MHDARAEYPRDYYKAANYPQYAPAPSSVTLPAQHDPYEKLQNLVTYGVSGAVLVWARWSEWRVRECTRLGCEYHLGVLQWAVCRNGIEPKSPSIV